MTSRNAHELLIPRLLVIITIGLVGCGSPGNHAGQLQSGNDSSGHADASAPTAASDAGADAGLAAAPPTPNDGLPCPISNALAANCQKCHSATPMFGAPMALVTYADLQKPSKDPSLTVAQAAQKRLDDKVSPMPPGGNISDDDRKRSLIG